MNPSREIRELLGKCWHEWEYYSPARLCADESDNKCVKCGIWESENPNPDYTSDPGKIQLLREIEKLLDSKLFFANLLYGPPESVEAVDDDGLIERRYFTDTTGLLAQKAVEWLRGVKV
jgi:hypothetical protein